MTTFRAERFHWGDDIEFDWHRETKDYEQRKDVDYIQDPKTGLLGGSHGHGGGDKEPAPADGHKVDAAKTEAKVRTGVARGAAQALARGVKPLQGSQGHPNLVASRNITAVKESKAAKGIYSRPDVAGMKTDPENFERDMALFKDPQFYPNFRAADTQGSSDEIARHVIDHMKANLKFIYDNSPDKEANRVWYDGARILVDKRVEQYGFTDASVAGVYAAMSPQKDWDENVYLADSIMDIWAKHQGHAWDAKMEATSQSIWKKEWQPVIDRIRGKTLEQAETAQDKAVWIRTYDQAHNDRFYRVVNPDGTFGEMRRTPSTGKLTPARWQSTPAIESAVQILQANGDPEKISEALSEKHKVRSFYNNILDPHSANGDVTIDTHAVGAALLRPLGGSTVPPAHNFGNRVTGVAGTSASAKTGSYGLYAVYADAVRELAAELGLQPRQLQSITWVTKRNLFDRTITDKQKKAIEAEWQDYYINPGRTQADVQKKVIEIMGGWT